MSDDLINVPDGAERFHVDGRNENFLVYNIADAVPEVDEPIYIAYRVYGSDERERITNSTDGWSDVSISEDEWNAMGVVEVGYSEELTADLPDHPWRQFEKNLEREAELRPWLLDEEFLELSAQAYLEGREITEAEMKTTDWWQESSQAERDWMELINSDPETAEQQLREATREIVHEFERRGWPVDEHNPPTGIADYYARQLVSGQIGEAELEDRIRHETDPYTRHASPFAGHYLQEDEEVVEYDGERFIRDPEGNYWHLTGPGQRARYNQVSQEYDSALDTTFMAGTAKDYFEQRDGDVQATGLGNVENVRQEFARWLGPHAEDVSDDTIHEWAHKIRRNEHAADELTEYLRGQRMSLFPNHENPNLTWQDISEPWKGLYRQFAGQLPEENSKFFRDLVQMNDYTEAERRLREKGLEEGWEPTMSEFLNDASQALGGTHRAQVGGTTRQARVGRQ